MNDYPCILFIKIILFMISQQMEEKTECHKQSYDSLMECSLLVCLCRHPLANWDDHWEKYADHGQVLLTPAVWQLKQLDEKGDELLSPVRISNINPY